MYKTGKNTGVNGWRDRERKGGREGERERGRKEERREGGMREGHRPEKTENIKTMSDSTSSDHFTCLWHAHCHFRGEWSKTNGYCSHIDMIRIVGM